MKSFMPSSILFAKTIALIKKRKAGNILGKAELLKHYIIYTYLK